MADPTETGGTTGLEGGATTGDAGLPAPASADPAPESGVPASSGQMESGAPASGQASETTEESFFDPSSLDPALMGGYKEMQGAFTRRMQELAQHRDKIKQYDSFMADPRTSIETLARQYGYQLSHGQQAAADNGQSNEWEPQTWNEVLDRTKSEARQDVMREIQPIMAQITQNELSRTLDIEVPGWRTYEERFTDTLMRHPTLREDVHALAAAAMPREVQESRAMQKAMKQLEKRGEGNKSKPGSSLRVPESPPGKMTFDQAAEFTLAQLAKQGKKVVGP